MSKRLSFTAAVLAILFCSVAQGAQDDISDADQLKIAALEALMAAPPERALPAVSRVLQGDHSDAVKESALFVLSQIRSPEAYSLLLQLAREGDSELRDEAIAMIGIGGDPASLAELRTLYSSSDTETRKSILEAFLIADDEDAVFDIAANASSDEEFDEAVEMLASMGAVDKLRQLRSTAKNSQSLIEAYAISGDTETLREMALNPVEPVSQVRAIEALGMVDDDESNDLLVQIYRESDSGGVREAALDGMMMSGYDDGLLELYRASSDPTEKRKLLEYLKMMNSDAVWDIVDSVLEETP